MNPNTEQPKATTSIVLSMLDAPKFDIAPNVTEYFGGREYGHWGRDNAYPDYLWNMYNSVGILQSIIDGLTDYTLGQGIINDTGIDHENSYGESVQDIVEKLILDRWLYGGFALQVKFNTFGAPIGLSYINIRRCRVDEHCKHVFVQDNWSKYKSKSYAKFNTFNPKTAAEDGVQIYYHKGPKTRSVYPIPDYNASIVSAEIQRRIKEFQINELTNNFTASGIINFNNGTPTDNERKRIEEGLNRKFTGTENAARTMVSFNDDTDHATTFVRLGTDDFADRYNAMDDSSIRDLFISLRVHPQLFGMTVQTGFADIEYDRAFELLNNTHVSKKQSEIERVFTKIFGKKVIRFIPFSIKEEQEDERQVA